MFTAEITENIYSDCTMCPRRCGCDRTRAPGRCRAGAQLRLARAALHFWEEPCISGKGGSGAVFFCGCQLGCVYCQNRGIAAGETGAEISVERLTDIFFELAAKGAHNINLVTPDCYIPAVAQAVGAAKKRGLALPFICNCSGYETAAMIDALAPFIDVWLPDFKYCSPVRAQRYSSAADYPTVARAAVDAMVRLQPECVFDGDGMIQKGVVIRHMMLPGGLDDSRETVSYLYNRYKNAVWLSLMSQYTPVGEPAYPELARRVTPREYDALLDFAADIGVENAYIQEGGAAEESFIPDFDCEGVLPQKP